VTDSAAAASSDRLVMLEKVLGAGSDDPFHHYAHAMELRSLGRDEDALSAYADVRSRYPDYVATYLMAAQLAQELERDDVAREWAESGIEKAKTAGEDRAVSELSQLLALLD